jgi:lambda family phage minor tail protein L
MADISQRFQETQPGAQVTFFELDLSPIGVSQALRFTNTNINGEPITWKGSTYQFVDVEAEGFEWSGTGPAPTPTIRVTNVNFVFATLVRDYEDLIGARLLRRRTFRSFIDGADTEAAEFEFPVDIYAVDRKLRHNNRIIEWQLASAIDQQGVTLPARQVLRDTCTHVYRRWDRETESFDYTQATCPYVGEEFFDLSNTPTTSDRDICSKQLLGCKRRFGENGNLPTRAFPGVGRIPV